MARQWSARCYGVARQRDGSRQNSIGHIHALLDRQITGRSFGIFGELRVNVLDLNLALQRTYPQPK